MLAKTLVLLLLSTVCFSATRQDLLDRIKTLEDETTALEVSAQDAKAYVNLITKENMSLFSVGTSTVAIDGSVIVPLLFSRGNITISDLYADFFLPSEFDADVLTSQNSTDGAKEVGLTRTGNVARLVIAGETSNVFVNGPVAYLVLKPTPQAISGNTYEIKIIDAVGIDSQYREVKMVSLGGTVVAP